MLQSQGADPAQADAKEVPAAAIHSSSFKEPGTTTVQTLFEPALPFADDDASFLPSVISPAKPSVQPSLLEDT